MNKGKFLQIAAVTLTPLLGIMALSQRTNAQDGNPRCNYGGTWHLRQSNGVFVTMELQQSGQKITGKASYDAGRRGIMRGTVTGTVRTRYGRGNTPSRWDTDVLHVEIAWYGAVGIYEGEKLVTAPHMSGSTWEKARPGNQASWESTGPAFSCWPER